VQSFVFLGLLVFELEPMYATSDGRTDGRTTDADHRIMPPRRGHNKQIYKAPCMHTEGCRGAEASRVSVRQTSLFLSSLEGLYADLRSAADV